MISGHLLCFIIMCFFSNYLSASFISKSSTPDWGSAIHEPILYQDISCMSTVTAKFKQAFRLSCDKMVNEILIDSELMVALSFGNYLGNIQMGYDVRLQVLQTLCDTKISSISDERAILIFESTLKNLIDSSSSSSSNTALIDEEEDRLRLRKQEIKRKNK